MNKQKTIKEAYVQMNEAKTKKAKNLKEFIRWFPEINKKIDEHFDLKKITITVRTTGEDTTFTVDVPEGIGGNL